MSTNTNRLSTDSNSTREWFELVNAKPEKWNIKQIINRIWNSITELFAPSSELRIFTGRDRYGNTYYRVYDALTQGFHRFESEDEVRIWLEQRYYH